MEIAILGAGTWGTALAQVLSDQNHQVCLYARDEEVAREINEQHTNHRYFSHEIILPQSIHATTSLQEAIEGHDVIVLAVPTAALRELLTTIEPLITKKVILVNTAKGFDPTSKSRISDLIREIIPEEKREAIVSLIGPGHAEEVILRQLTLVTATSLSLKAAHKIQHLFSNSYFRVYTNSDEIAAEYGVALKNAIAIASGVLEGLGYGDNARAALVTRGLHEMVRFGRHFGGNGKTYLGLTGLGDLMVTCNSHHSRNFMAGVQIAKDGTAEHFMNSKHATTEGIKTVEIVYEIAQQEGIYMPIVGAIYEVLYQHRSPKEVITQLMINPLKKEED